MSWRSMPPVCAGGCAPRHGHNEMDDPRATMPLTCAAIDTHPRVLQLYSNVLATRFEAASAGMSW